jgi:hypothetical protein
MRQLLAVVVCIAIPFSVFAGEVNYKVTYDGGSLSDLKTGTGLHLYIEQEKVRFVRDGKEVAAVPTSAITEISYGQDVHRRVGTAIGLAVVSFGIGALMALSKSKKHYVGLTWADGDKKGGLAMQCDKNEYRGILAGLDLTSGNVLSWIFGLFSKSDVEASGKDPMRHIQRVLSATTLALVLFVQLFVQAQSATQQGNAAGTPNTAQAKAQQPQPNCTNNGTYTNSKGQTVQRPENCSSAPKGATAQCRDGSYSFSQSRSGTCSHHGGVAKWL